MWEIVIKATIGAIVATIVGSIIKCCCTKNGKAMRPFKIRMYRSRIREDKFGSRDIRQSGIDIRLGRNGGDDSD